MLLFFILSVLHLNFTYLSGFNVLLLMIDGDFVTALVGNNTNDFQVASEKSCDNSGQALSNRKNVKKYLK